MLRRLFKASVLSFTFLIFFVVSPSKTYANILFSDDFSDGDAANWLVSGTPGWTVVDGQYGISLNPGLSNSYSDDSLWDYSWTNITYEVSLRGVSGTDKNILVKFKDASNFLEIHHTNGILYLDRTGFPTLDSAAYPLVNGQTYTFKVDIENNQHIRVYIDDSAAPVLEADDPEPRLEEWKVGLRVGTGSVSPSQVWFDNVKVSTYEDDPGLDVPYYSQVDPTWAFEEYNSASVWTGPGDATTIGRWGCALSDAAMILNYHGYDFTPLTLNNWLKLNKGFVGDGFVNWASLASYTVKNPLPGVPKLEFSYHSPSIELVEEQTALGQPVVLKYLNDQDTPSRADDTTHFVLGKGVTEVEGVWQIIVLDPNSVANTLSSDIEEEYSSELVAIGTFNKSETDVSYIVLSLDDNFEMKVFDENGVQVTDFLTTDAPYMDPATGTSASGNLQKLFYFAKPESGQYKVEITGDGDYELGADFFDTLGDIEDNNLPENVASGAKDVYVINFDKNSSANSSIEIEVPVDPVTFDSVIEDLDDAYQAGKIKKGFYKLLKTELMVAERFYEKGRKILMRATLKVVVRELERQSPRLINNDVADDLIAKIGILKDL